MTVACGAAARQGSGATSRNTRSTVVWSPVLHVAHTGTSWPVVRRCGRRMWRRVKGVLGVLQLPLNVVLVLVVAVAWSSASLTRRSRRGAAPFFRGATPLQHGTARRGTTLRPLDAALQQRVYGSLRRCFFFSSGAAVKLGVGEWGCSGVGVPGGGCYRWSPSRPPMASL
jgi:hypothetical protein